MAKALWRESGAGIPVTQELAERSGKFFDEFEWTVRASKAKAISL